MIPPDWPTVDEGEAELERAQARQASRVGGAIGRGVDDATRSNTAGLWDAYDRYRARLQEAGEGSSVPPGTDAV